MLTPYHRKNRAPIETDAHTLDNENSELMPKAIGSERRTTQRYPIQLPAELCIGEKRICGTTVNISSGGLLIKCSDDAVKIGGHVNVRITNWPNSSRNNSEVVLMIEGAVVRNWTGYVAVRRMRYKFVEVLIVRGQALSGAP